MTLEEIISLKLKSLYVEIERLRNNSLKLDEETEKLTMVLLESEEFIHTMSEDWANIGKLDVDKMTDYLIKYGSFAYDKKEVEMLNHKYCIINIHQENNTTERLRRSGYSYDEINVKLKNLM